MLELNYGDDGRLDMGQFDAVDVDPESAASLRSRLNQLARETGSAATPVPVIEIDSAESVPPPVSQLDVIDRGDRGGQRRAPTRWLAYAAAIVAVIATSYLARPGSREILEVVAKRPWLVDQPAPVAQPAEYVPLILTTAGGPIRQDPHGITDQERIGTVDIPSRWMFTSQTPEEEVEPFVLAAGEPMSSPTGPTAGLWLRIYPDAAEGRQLRAELDELAAGYLECSAAGEVEVAPTAVPTGSASAQQLDTFDQLLRNQLLFAQTLSSCNSVSATRHLIVWADASTGQTIHLTLYGTTEYDQDAARAILNSLQLEPGYSN